MGSANDPPNANTPLRSQFGSSLENPVIFYLKFFIKDISPLTNGFGQTTDRRVVEARGRLRRQYEEAPNRWKGTETTCFVRNIRKMPRVDKSQMAIIRARDAESKIGFCAIRGGSDRGKEV